MALMEDVKELLGLEDNTVEARWWRTQVKSERDLDDGDFAWVSDEWKSMSPAEREKANFAKHHKLPYKIHGKVNEVGWRAAWTRAHQEGTDLSGGPSREEVIAKLKRDKPKGIEIQESKTTTVVVTDETTAERGKPVDNESAAAEEQVAEDITEAKDNVTKAEDNITKAEDNTTQADEEYRRTVEEFQKKVVALEAELGNVKAESVELKAALEANELELKTAKAEANRARLSLNRAMQLVPYMDAEKITASASVLGEMGEEAFNLFLELRQSVTVDKPEVEKEPIVVEATKDKSIEVKGAVLDTPVTNEPVLSWANFGRLLAEA